MCGDTFAPPMYAPDRIRPHERANNALLRLQKIFSEKIGGIPGNCSIV
jgi:hypothetical protein